MHEIATSGHMLTMTTTPDSPATFSGSVTASHADQLRAERDRTDDDIRDGYARQVSDHDVALDRSQATSTRRDWERRAVTNAVDNVVMDYLDASARSGTDGKVVDLEGVTISVSVTDLVATATLTAPTA